MFSISDLKEVVYPAVYKRGKELYEAGGVFDFSYEMYLNGEYPEADMEAKVRGSSRAYYTVSATVDEEFAEVEHYKCNCEAYYNYPGMCKHCVAVVLNYVNRRTPMEILKLKNPDGMAEQPAEDGAGTPETPEALKSLLGQYSMRAASRYLLSEDVYGKVELAPNFAMAYGYATVDFKIGVESKYVLKNISAFLSAVASGERVHYGKKLDFYHHMEAFTEDAKRLIAFLQQQDEDKKRQSKYHAYYVYTGAYEREMELDGVGIDRFFAAVGGMPFSASVGYEASDECVYRDEVKKPRLWLRGGSAGVFLEMEELSVIEGSRYYYFYEDEEIRRSTRALREKLPELFDFLRRQTGGECYIAAAELQMFCRDVLPMIKENFALAMENFDETLYVPPKPEFELYLDRKGNGAVGAKLVSVYGEKKYNALADVEAGEVRDMFEEQRAKNLVGLYFGGADASGTLFVTQNEDLQYQLISGGLQRLANFMSIYTSDKFRSMRVACAPRVSVGVSLKSDLLELEIHSDEMSSEELAYLLMKYDRKKKYIRLKNGDFLDIKEDGFGVLAAIREDLQLAETSLKKGHIVVPKYRAMYLDAALKDNALLTVEKNRAFKGMVRSMKTIEDSDYEVPESLKDIMRNYQKTGFLWLKMLRENGFGGILADDMGLGKTLQVISLLLSEQEECEAGLRERKRSLIVCPASLIYNWKKEIERFAPSLAAVAVTGGAGERRDIIRHTRDGEILITSYDLLKRDMDGYRDMVFSVQVIDEAQYIKNSGTQSARAVKKITAAFKLALTGTPIENRLSELWSIFDYLMPGFLYSYQRFREEIEMPVVTNRDEERMARLQRMIRPFVLRRLKGDVLKDLPEKLEENVFAKLSGEQLSLYDAHVLRIRGMLEGQTDAQFAAGKIQILAELTKLRQLCCDPALLYENYQGGSAKTEMCMDLIENAVNGGHKVLLFSQFTTMLDRLAKRLDALGIRYYMLTGSVRKEKRMQMVDSFGTDDVPVFCISLKAGGTGLNLTAADIVIHYDPWWNVAVQNQATDRAHRIGQKNVVTVYKLVSQGTIEEKIISIQERKRQLAERVLAGDGMDSATFTREEMLELLS